MYNTVVQQRQRSKFIREMWSMKPKKGKQEIKVLPILKQWYQTTFCLTFAVSV